MHTSRVGKLFFRVLESNLRREVIVESLSASTQRQLRGIREKRDRRKINRKVANNKSPKNEKKIKLLRRSRRSKNKTDKPEEIEKEFDEYEHKNQGGYKEFGRRETKRLLHGGRVG